MKVQRITLKVSIALATFMIGVAAVALIVAYRTPAASRLDDPPCATSPFGTLLPDSHARYFPAGALRADEMGEYSLTSWYARSLKAMGEPAFPGFTARGVEAYRFLWMRSFHPAVAIRVWRGAGGYCMSVKQLDRADEHVDGKFVAADRLAVERVSPLSPDEWLDFQTYLSGAGFWSVPSMHQGPLANDGAFWVLEALEGQRYHVVERQSPSEGAYREACLYLLKLSGLDVRDDELY